MGEARRVGQDEAERHIGATIEVLGGFAKAGISEAAIVAVA
jgi:hypothetical protein